MKELLQGHCTLSAQEMEEGQICKTLGEMDQAQLSTWFRLWTGSKNCCCGNSFWQDPLQKQITFSEKATLHVAHTSEKTVSEEALLSHPNCLEVSAWLAK